jgi:hypothetical protein
VYDKIFSSGTVASDELVHLVDDIREGKVREASQIKTPSVAYRQRLGLLEW